MFTGIIQEIGKVVWVKKQNPGVRLLIQAPRVLANAKTGDSIATNGVCLTISELNGHFFAADISPETFSRTYFGRLKTGDPVNLEPAMRLGDRLGGHLVTGHIDGTAKLISCRREGEFTTLTFNVPHELRHGRVVYKGSVAVDGVSLTVADCQADRFSIALIPQTLNSTTLCYKKPGERVHIELDIIGKYIEGLILDTGMKKSGINKEFLAECGY